MRGSSFFVMGASVLVFGERTVEKRILANELYAFGKVYNGQGIASAKGGVTYDTQGAWQVQDFQ